ncbi:hypothetical protein N431DRAFT_298421, partial [Stipitochalara longipes BDJ]
SLYRPLDFDTFEIRLLRVHGFDGLGYITWSLEYASLINPPEYTALSYCWGDAGKTKTINIKHWGTVQISSNLDDALWHLCYMEESDPFRHGKGIIVWVDALCINQEDAVERSQQVRQMRQIYSRAKEVISWVPCQESEAVAYLIKNQFHRDNYETTGQVQKAQPPRASYNVHLEFEECEDKRKVWMKRGWKILDKFFRQAYWRRVWVIQEVAVAAKAKVLCGRYEITWEDIDAIIATWQKTPGSVPVNTRAYLKAVHLVEFRDRFQVKREPISLLDAMRWTYQTEATDPRDKIFALLGLCHDGATYVPVPNYKQPLEEIIADMSKAMMSFDRSLDLMCFKGTSLSEEGKLPSWTPNWVNLWSGSLHSMTLHEARYADWHTTFPFNPILYGSTPQILKVDGKFYGTIRHLTSELAQPGPDGKLTLTIEPRAQSIPSTSLLSIDSRHSNPEPIDITIRDSIWKTMTMNLLPPEFHDNTAAWCFAKLWTPEGRGAVQNLALIAWLDRNARFQAKVRVFAMLGADRATFEKATTTAADAEGETAVHNFDEFIETLERVLGSGMRLGVIGEGHSDQPVLEDSDRERLVLAPPGTMETDQIWFIRGCSVPIVLREVRDEKDETKYKVIGGVYLNDYERGCFDVEERWTRGEEIPWKEGGPTVLHLC